MFENEEREALSFKIVHGKVCEEAPTAIGGRWSYTFTPTGVGTVVKVTCGICGAYHDVTDYESW